MHVTMYKVIVAATATAKLLQSCPTLCDPIDGSPPGSAVPGILQARTLEWVAISFSNKIINFNLNQQCRHGCSVCPNLCNPMNHSMPGLSVHHQIPESTQTHVHWVCDAIQQSHLCRPLLLLPSIFPSIRVFSNESALCIRWPKYWRFSFSISPSNEHSELVSFRMDWLDFLAVQGTLKNLLQHQSSKASILWCSAFFIVQLSHPYMITGKTIALTRQTFV